MQGDKFTGVNDVSTEPAQRANSLGGPRSVITIAPSVSLKVIEMEPLLTQATATGTIWREDKDNSKPDQDKELKADNGKPREAGVQRRALVVPCGHVFCEACISE
jgi:hypothetical protein